MSYFIIPITKKTLFKERNTTTVPSIFGDYESLPGSCNSLETVLATLNFI